MLAHPCLLTYGEGHDLTQSTWPQIKYISGFSFENEECCCWWWFSPRLMYSEVWSLPGDQHPSCLRPCSPGHSPEPGWHTSAPRSECSEMERSVTIESQSKEKWGLIKIVPCVQIVHVIVSCVYMKKYCSNILRHWPQAIRTVEFQKKRKN